MGFCLFGVDLLFKDYHSDQKFTITTYSPTGVVSVFYLILQFLWHKHNAWNGYLFCCWVCYWMFFLACVSNNVGEIKELFEESRMVLLEVLCPLSISWLWEVCFMDFFFNKIWVCIVTTIDFLAFWFFISCKVLILLNYNTKWKLEVLLAAFWL